MWIPNLTAGQGWIAIALVIFALWNPLRAALGAYLFGGINALQLRLQAVGTVLPVHFLLMLPYMLTIAVLVFISVRKRRTGRIESPTALGIPFFREDSSWH
jgi:simple sugar transport system permease protein